MGQMDLLQAFFVRFFFSKLSGKHFSDRTLQMYEGLDGGGSGIHYSLKI